MGKKRTERSFLSARLIAATQSIVAKVNNRGASSHRDAIKLRRSRTSRPWNTSHQDRVHSGAGMIHDTCALKRAFHLYLCSSFVAILLLLGGLLQSQSVAHSLHHIDHNATTHAKAICSWMCAAGLALQGIQLNLDGPHEVVGNIDLLPSHPNRHGTTPLPLSRAPPAPRQ